MNLIKLVEKINKLNTLNKELDLDYKYGIVIFSKYSQALHITDKKSLKLIKEIYIDETTVSLDKLINKELVKKERYEYKLDKFIIMIECL